MILRPTLPRSRCGRRSFTLSGRLTALAHRVIEHVEDGLAQRLGAVNPDQDRAGDVRTPPMCRPTSRPVTTSISPSSLRPQPADASARRCRYRGSDTAGFGEVDQADHQRHPVQPGLSCESAHQGGLGCWRGRRNRRKPVEVALFGVLRRRPRTLRPREYRPNFGKGTSVARATTRLDAGPSDIHSHRANANCKGQT